MKKVLSFILALAMVLTMVPFVFAQDAAAGTTYDFAEAFAINSSNFTEDNKNSIYENLISYLTTPNDGTGMWSVYGQSLTSGVEDQYPSHLSRIWTTNKAPDDGINTGANSLVFGHGVTGTADAGDWAISTSSSLGWRIGYSFGATDYHVTGSHPGNTEYRATVKFVVPEAGTISPVLTLNTKAAFAGGNGALFKVYKETADGTVTNIYSGTESTTNDNTSDWIALPSGTANTWNNGAVDVAANDVIYLVFDCRDGDKENDDFEIIYYAMNYINSESKTYAAEFDPTTREVDLRDAFGYSIDNATISVPEDVLTEAGTEGVYELADTYEEGTAVTVTATYGSVVITVECTFKEYQMVFDLAEAYYTTGVDYATADAATKYPSTGSTPLGSDVWDVGYYNYNSIETLNPFSVLIRRESFMAYEDVPTQANMVWTNINWVGAYAITNSNWWLSADGAYFLADVNSNEGSLGYSFDRANNTIYNSSIGWNTDAASTNHQAAVFTAPRDGVIVPKLEANAAAADQVAYRMYKKAADGAITQIYPSAEQDSVTLEPNFADAHYDNTTIDDNWGLLPAYSSLLTQDSGMVRVNKGDEIITRFAGHKAGHTAYHLELLTMTYQEETGDDEGLLSSPMENYPAVTNYYYSDGGDNIVDLSRPFLTEANGTVEYTVTGNADVLKPIAGAAGMFSLTGELNAYGEAARVTASYYSPGTSSADSVARFTTYTDVYVNAASAQTEPFSGYDIFTTSDNGYDYDSFVLPYYSDAAERAIYGTIDLGLADAWKNAAVSFDQSGFEYLGNGRVRALKAHNFNGTRGGAGDGTTTTSISGAELTSKRDSTTLGTPVVMTVTAPDGGVKKFGLWSFDARVQAEGEDKNAYRLIPSATSMSNAVISVEAYTPDFAFVPTYQDVADTTHYAQYSPIADHRYTTNVNWSATHVPVMDLNGNIILHEAAEGTWNGFSDEAYPNLIGISQTFTAPRDGTINLTDYFPTEGFSSDWTIPTTYGHPFECYVQLYDADGSFITNLWQQNYGAVSATATVFTLLDTPTINENLVTVDETTKALSFAVEKGQKVRVMIGQPWKQGYWYTYFFDTEAPAPVFTYAALGEGLENSLTVAGDDASGYTASVVAYVPNGESIVPAGTLMLAYDENGNLVGSKVGDDTIVYPGTAEFGSVGTVYTTEPFATSAPAAYVKIFFWESLDNIKPLIGDVIVR